VSDRIGDATQAARGSTADIVMICEEVVQVYASASGPVHALRGVDACFHKGTVTAVVGPSGAGKSTLLRLLACVERPVAGEIRVDGLPTAHLTGRARRHVTGTRIGYVFQRPRENLLDYLSVREHLVLAVDMRRGDRASVPQLVEWAGLSAASDLRPIDISAGEQQKLALAMAVAGSPAIVIADEPSAELDEVDTVAISKLITGLAAVGQTFVVSTHDTVMLAVADTVLAIDHGAVAARGRPGAMLCAIDRSGRLMLGAAADGFPDHLARIIHHPDHLRVEKP
jgi:putative ABC transport system ATP-binding protein